MVFLPVVEQEDGGTWDSQELAAVRKRPCSPESYQRRSITPPILEAHCDDLIEKRSLYSIRCRRLLQVITIINGVSARVADHRENIMLVLTRPVVNDTVALEIGFTLKH